MKAAAAGMLSAAVLLSPGCNPPQPARETAKDEPLRRASFRSLAARDFLVTCPGTAARRETAQQMTRYEELKQLAYRKDAGYVLWLGENDWRAVSRHSRREPCAAGEEEYREALAAFSGTLDTLAGRIAGYQP